MDLKADGEKLLRRSGMEYFCSITDYMLIASLIR